MLNSIFNMLDISIYISKKKKMNADILETPYVQKKKNNIKHQILFLWKKFEVKNTASTTTQQNPLE